MIFVVMYVCHLFTLFVHVFWYTGKFDGTAGAYSAYRLEEVSFYTLNWERILRELGVVIQW